jgi:hypothetical protein
MGTAWEKGKKEEAASQQPGAKMGAKKAARAPEFSAPRWRTSGGEAGGR